MKIKEITAHLEHLAPLYLQEDYDNSGLQVGDIDKELTSVMLCLDVTKQVVDEAISLGANMIISHHPMIFKGIKSLRPGRELDDMIIKAIKNDICIYSAHTNLDSMLGGVSYALADKLGLVDVKPLQVSKGKLYKIVVYAPRTHTQSLSDAIFRTGAGEIGNYSKCSFTVSGEGSFFPKDGANPYIGKCGELEILAEDKIEVLAKDVELSAVVDAIRANHPYEEPAYDIIEVEQKYAKAALGVVGYLPNPMTVVGFLANVKELTGSGVKYSDFNKEMIHKVALCGGSGSFLIGGASAVGADAYLTGDIKYHDFFGYEDKMLLADIGHYESEKYTIELIHNFLVEKFGENIDINTTKIKTNPINYL